MRRKEIEEAAQEFYQGHYFPETIEFAIEQVNKALDEAAAVSISCDGIPSDAIRALKIE